MALFSWRMCDWMDGGGGGGALCVNIAELRAGSFFFLSVVVCVCVFSFL
jgi:hypothetical protein